MTRLDTDDAVATETASECDGPRALLLEARPFTSRDDLLASLSDTAIDIGAAGFDFDSGHGLIDTNAAVNDLQSGANNLVITAWDSLTANVGDDDTDDAFVLTRDGGDLVITIDAVETGRIAYANVASITVIGSDDDDMLTIDHTGSGGPIDIGVTFTGGDGDDQLSAIGGPNLRRGAPAGHQPNRHSRSIGERGALRV